MFIAPSVSVPSGRYSGELFEYAVKIIHVFKSASLGYFREAEGFRIEHLLGMLNANSVEIVDGALISAFLKARTQI